MSQHLLCKSHTCLIASYHLNIPGRLMLVLDCVFRNRAERGELCPVQPQSSPSSCSWSAGVGGAHPFHWCFGECGWGGMMEGSCSPSLHAWVCVGILSQNTTARKRMGWRAFSDRCSARRAQPGVCLLMVKQRLNPTGLSFSSGTSRHEHG